MKQRINQIDVVLHKVLDTALYTCSIIDKFCGTATTADGPNAYKLRFINEIFTSGMLDFLCNIGLENFHLSHNQKVPCSWVNENIYGSSAANPKIAWSFPYFLCKAVSTVCPCLGSRSTIDLSNEEEYTIMPSHIKEVILYECWW